MCIGSQKCRAVTDIAACLALALLILIPDRLPILIAYLHLTPLSMSCVFMAGHELHADEQQADQKRLLLERFQAEVRTQPSSKALCCLSLPTTGGMHA